MKKLKNLIKRKLKWSYIIIKYNNKNGRINITCPGFFEDRSVKTVELFMMAFEYAKKDIKKSFKLYINVEDYPEKGFPVMAYTKTKEDNNVIMIPDFCFINWKESGMKDYDECWQQIVEMSKKAPEYDTLFWIGNIKTHPTRVTLCEISQKDKRIEAYGMGWENVEGKNVPTKYISLIDHTKYKYLIDVQGRGYSGRTKLLMFSGRPLFIADRKWSEFWLEDIKPYEHYIPVKEDLSDLSEKLDWAENNQDKVLEIAKNAQKYALTHLRREDALNYLTNSIIEYSEKYGKT